jgi:hypothetical protein
VLNRCDAPATGAQSLLSKSRLVVIGSAMPCSAELQQFGWLRPGCALDHFQPDRAG